MYDFSFITSILPLMTTLYTIRPRPHQARTCNDILHILSSPVRPKKKKQRAVRYNDEPEAQMSDGEQETV